MSKTTIYFDEETRKRLNDLKKTLSKASLGAVINELLSFYEKNLSLIERFKEKSFEKLIESSEIFAQ